MKQDKYLNTTFMRNGHVIVTSEQYDHKVVVGVAEKASGMWVLRLYKNCEGQPAFEYYGKRRVDLAIFARYAYYRIIREASA